MGTRSISSRRSRAGSIGVVRGASLLLVLAACGFSVNGQGPVSGDAPRDDGGGGGEGAGTGSDASAPDAALDAALDAPTDPPVDARICPAAPPGCSLFQCPSTTSCYYLCGQGNKDEWEDARDACTDDHLGHLATIEDKPENMCLAQMTHANISDIVWFGWVQASNGSEPGGGWGWEFGMSSYRNWGFTEPNDIGNEDCGALVNDGAWIDANCSNKARWVCELL